MRAGIRRRLDRIKQLLGHLNFPERFRTDQTAISLLALLDSKPRARLLAGKSSLRDGARIHDILEFARRDVGIRIAENTRESYRKASLRPLYEAALITRHQLSTNDPNTFYRLHPEILAALEEPHRPVDAAHIEALKRRVALHAGGLPQVGGLLRVAIGPGKHARLSPGGHNELERAIVESFGPRFLQDPIVVFIGDAAKKSGYQNRRVMRELNLPLEVTRNLPDVILASEADSQLIVAEAVVTSGVIDESRLEQLGRLTSGASQLGYTPLFLTAFPSRMVLRRFVDALAWGTAVWTASEPGNLILFQRARR